MKFFSKHILIGLVTVLPVLLTSYLLIWLALSAEKVLGDGLRDLLPDAVYWPGMGLAAALLGLLLVGLLMNAYVVRRVFSMGETMLYKVPVIKTVYGAISDFLTYFSSRHQRERHQVVAVTVAGNLQLIGFLTRDNTGDLPPELRGEDKVLVYMPFSYQIGGYTVAVPREAITPMNMTMEQAMRFTLTGGVTREYDPPAAQAGGPRDNLP